MAFFNRDGTDGDSEEQLYARHKSYQDNDDDDPVPPELLQKQQYGEMLLQVSAHLTKEHSVMLATYYNISPYHRQRIEDSETPGLTLLHLLEERNVISSDRVSSLIVALGKIDLQIVAQVVNSYSINVRRRRIEDAPVDDLPSIPSPPVDVDDKLEFFIDELRNTYTDLFLARPVPWEEKTPLDDLYIKQELSYIERKSNNERKLSSYKDLLRQAKWEKTKRILLVGNAGMGKTTCMLKIAHDWATGKKPIKNKRFVILLFLRDVAGETPLAQAVVDHLLPNDSVLFVSDVQRLLRKYERHCLLLLDGHDELRAGRRDIRQPKECATIQRVVDGALFRNLSIWITSRPSNVETTLFNVSSYRRFHVEGFSIRKMEEFIGKTFRGNKVFSHIIWDHIRSNSVLSDFCKAPIFLALISQMQYENLTLPSGDLTDTEQRNDNLSDTLLKLFTAMNVHWEKKYTSCSSQDATFVDINTFQNRLGKMALDGLAKQGRLQLCWNKREFLGKVGEDIYNTGRDMGVLLEKTITRPIWESFQTYSEQEVMFTHQLYQEWLAARYVASYVIDEESIFAILKDVDVVSYKCLILFVCGMSEILALLIMKYLYVNKLYLLLPECFFQCNTGVSLRSVPIIGVPIVEVDLSGGNYLKEAVIHFLVNCSKSKIPVAEMIFKGREFRVKCSRHFLGSECPWYQGVASLTVAQISFHSLHVSEECMANILYWTMKQTCRVVRFFDCTLPGSLPRKFLTKSQNQNRVEESRGSFPVGVYDVTRDCSLNFTTGRWDKISSEQTLKLLAYNSDCRERCLSHSEAFNDFDDLNDTLVND